MRFVLCCIPKGQRLRSYEPEKDFDVLAFEARPFSVKELRRLAPATNPMIACLVVEWSRSEVLITGIVHLGSSWSVTKKGLSYDLDRPPHALQVEVNGRGRLTAYRGQYRVASLSGGTVRPNSLEHDSQLDGIVKIVNSGLRAMVGIKKFRSPLDGDADMFEVAAYINVIFSILNGIESKHHGGTLLLNAPGLTSRCAAFLKRKYAVPESSILRDAFLKFIQARHAFRHMIEKGRDEEASPKRTLEMRGIVHAVEGAQNQLNSAASLIAGLAGVDGAVWLGADLVCHGFGCEIITDSAPPVEAYTIEGARAKLRPLNSEDFGMRHRSALRLCGAMAGVAAFVCSQDGGVSLIWKEHRKVFKRAVLPINSLLVGA